MADGHRIPRGEQRAVLEAFARATTREAHNLAERPDSLWQQLYNRLQFMAEGGDGAVGRLVEPELRRRREHPPRPWLHLLNRPQESPAYVRTLAGHQGRLRGVAFLPDARRLVSACDDGLLRIWDVVSGMRIRRAERRPRRRASLCGLA